MFSIEGQLSGIFFWEHFIDFYLNQWVTDTLRKPHDNLMSYPLYAIAKAIGIEWFKDIK
jgi:hypothetical protein